MRRQSRGHRAHRSDGLGPLVGGQHVVSSAEKVDDVPAMPAPGIQDSRATGNRPTQQLIEQVDVDVAELIDERLHARFTAPILSGG